MQRSLVCGLTALAILVLLVPLSASAQLYGDVQQESPRSHQIALKFGPYLPNIDGSAYETAFGDDSIFMFRFEYDYQFFKTFGSLAVGFEVGYGSVTGKGQAVDDATTSGDETRLQMVPLALSLVYALDVMAVRYNIPLVPEFEFGFDWVHWWIEDGTGETSTYSDGVDTFTGAGATLGWHVSVGLKLLLDTMAPNMAQTFDTEVGVNNSYLFAELLYADISDFGSDTSWDVGTLTGMFGLAFEF
ncbi:MAG: hypothetical protein ACI9WU_003055 [Myxococcota bacterium]|jgi:hypothetical protein